jgi:hypothetical protein
VKQVDVIIGSELIYNEENYEKIQRVIREWMKPEGCAVLANKQYYFGVGGNTMNFKEYLEQQHFNVEVLKKIDPPKGGNRKEIDKITFGRE